MGIARKRGTCRRFAVCAIHIISRADKVDLAAEQPDFGEGPLLIFDLGDPPHDVEVAPHLIERGGAQELGSLRFWCTVSVPASSAGQTIDGVVFRSRSGTRGPSARVPPPVVASAHPPIPAQKGRP